MKEKILNIARIVVLSFILSTAIGYSLADWAPPPACGAPPCGNTPPPINVGAAPQMRDGMLFISNRLFASAGIFGDVGVGGVTFPTEKVDVLGNIKASGAGIFGSVMAGTLAPSSWILSVGSQNNPTIPGPNAPFNVTDSGDTIVTGGTDSKWALYDKDAHRIIQWNAIDDTMGIAGTEDPTYTVRVHGSIAYNSGGVISDARYKKNVEPIREPMAKIMGLNGVTFDWNHEKYPNEQFKKGKDSGFIAQEVEKVFPEVVLTDSQGYKALEYGNLSALLVEGIKQQQKEIIELKIKNQALETKLDKLIEKLEQ